MNKKILMPLALVLVLSLSFFVSASLKWAEGYYGISENQLKQKQVYVMKGWNLIQGFADPSFISSGISQEDIKAIFAVDLNNKQYYRVYPNPEKNKLDNLGPVILQLPFWVYSEKEATMTYSTEKLSASLQIEWPRGWNLVSVSDEMVGKNLNEIKGSCNIEKAYWWSDKENSKGSWVSFPSDVSFDKSLVGLGIALKFSSECKLGSSSSGSGSTITAPPAIPNGNENEGECTETDGGTVIDVKGTVTRNGQTKKDFCETSDLLVEYDCDWDNGGIIRELKFSCSDLSFSRCENGRCI